jgi:hypothetical protein
MEWISTQYKLPKCTQKVSDYSIGCKLEDSWLESETVLIVVKEEVGKDNYDSYVTLARIDEKNTWWTGEDAIDWLKKNQEVTHWMPMPKLPTF